MKKLIILILLVLGLRKILIRFLESTFMKHYLAPALGEGIGNAFVDIFENTYGQTETVDDKWCRSCGWRVDGLIPGPYPWSSKARVQNS